MCRSELLVLLLPVSLALACGGDPRVTSGAPAISPGSSLPVLSVKIAWDGMPLAQGNSVQLNVMLRDEHGATLSPRPVTWASSDPTIASVSASGVMTGISRTGTVTITATSEGKSDSTKVTTCWVYIFEKTPTYKIAASSFTILDDVRSRDIPILVGVPVGAPQPVPVVFDVFALPNGQQADPSLGETFVGAGYAVVHVGVAPYSQAQLCAELHVDDCAAMIWPNRISAARDVKVLMDNLSTIGKRAGVLLDSTRVGISGTSSGGAVVMYLAGATMDLSPNVRGVSLADKRFTAFLGNSAPAFVTDNGSATGFTVGAWASITKPTMQQVLRGDADAAGRRGIYDVMLPGDKYLAFFDTSAVDQYEPNQTGAFGPLIASNTVAFFDAYLRGSAVAKDWLRTNQLARASNGAAQMTSK